jgi:Mitochondrial carrier protein
MPIHSKEVDALGPWGKAVAGALGAVLANTLVYPLDIVKTRLQVQSSVQEIGDERERYNGTADAIKKIYAKRGILGLYSGLVGSLIGVASQNFAYFYWYGLIRGAYSRRHKNISTAAELLLGALAAALAQIFTIPVSVVTTRQQTSEEDESLAKAAKGIIEEDGVAGLWRGLKASLVLVVNPSITYGAFERLRTAFLQGRAVLTPGQSFLLGAASKSMATVATQPLIVAKVLQQSSDKKRRHKSFVDALAYLYGEEGVRGLFRGLGPQISKGVLVQGLLFMFRDQIELLLILLVRALRKGVRKV